MYIFMSFVIFFTSKEEKNKKTPSTLVSLFFLGNFVNINSWSSFSKKKKTKNTLGLSTYSFLS